MKRRTRIDQGTLRMIEAMVQPICRAIDPSNQ
jgi:hypothetical protein